MTVTDEIRKTLSDPKPLYALAGFGDLAAERLKDAPALAAEAAQAVSDLANRVATEAPDRIAKVQARLAEVPGALDPKTAREVLRESAAKIEPQALRSRAQGLALMQVGRMLEAVGRAVETYDGLAERGKAVVAKYRGDGSTVAGYTVVVEQVVDELDDDAVERDQFPLDDEAFEAAAFKQARATETQPLDPAAANKPADAPATTPAAHKRTTTAKARTGSSGHGGASAGRTGGGAAASKRSKNTPGPGATPKSAKN